MKREAVEESETSQEKKVLEPKCDDVRLKQEMR